MICRTCHVDKPDDAFRMVLGGGPIKKFYRAHECRQCYNAKHVVWDRANGVKHRASREDASKCDHCAHFGFCRAAVEGGRPLHHKCEPCG